MSIPSPRSMFSSDSCLPQLYLLEKDHPQDSATIQKYLASSSCGLIPLSTNKIAEKEKDRQKNRKIKQHRLLALLEELFLTIVRKKIR